MIIEVQGQHIEVPDGLTQAQLGEVVDTFVSSSQSAIEQERPKTSRTGAMIEGAKQGASMGLYDEFMAGLTAGIGSMTSKDMSFSDIYGPSIQQLREEYANARKDRPGYTLAGEAAGGIATALTGTGAAAKVAPAATGVLKAYAKTRPYIAASGAGGISGAVYGAGTGEGDLRERGEEALAGGVAGAALGPAATFVGRNIVRPAAGQVTRAVAKLKSAEKSALVPETSPKNLSDIAKPSGEFFSKTAGERTQNPNTQALEADALGGRFGPESVSQISNAKRVQNQERQAFVNAIDQRASDASEVNDVLDGVYSRVSQKAKELDQRVDSAYSIARQGNQVKIDAHDIRTGLMSEIGRVRNETAINLSDKVNYSKANAVVKALGKKIALPKDGKITAVKLGDLEDWRKTLTAYANDAKGTEKAFLGKVRSAYDDFMIKTANEAVDSGDAEAISAFRNAVGLRRQYGQLFEKNAIVESIANGKTADDFAKDLIGTGAIAGKKGMLDNVKALVAAGGDDSPAVRADLATTFAKRLYTKAIDGFEPNNPEQAFISPTKLMNGLEEMFVKNRELAEYLYGKDAVIATRKAIPELRLIARKQPGTQNPSGSGYMIARVLRNTGITRIPGLSLINNAFESAQSAAGQARVEKSLAEFINEAAKPKSPLFTQKLGTSGGIVGGALTNETGESRQEPEKREPYKITVRPRK